MFSRTRSSRRAAALAATVLAASLVGPVALSPAGAATTTLSPEADARVEQSNPNTNYGSSSRLQADGSPVVESLLRFNVTTATGPITRARLRVHALDSTDNGPAVYGANGAWSEGGITWNTKPARSGAVVADVGSVKKNAWVEYNVTSLVAGNGQVTFNLVSTSSDGLDFDSREASSRVRPQLIVDYTPPTTTTSSTTTSSTTTSSTTTSSTTTSSTSTTTTAPATTGTVTLGPAADARAEGANPATNFGSATMIGVDNSPLMEAYLRFDVGSLPGRPTAAKLRLYVTDPTGDGPNLFSAATGWSESSLTWNNRPALGGQLGDISGSLTTGTWAEYDISAVITGTGSYGFGLTGDSGDGVDFNSREASSNKPQLVITWNNDSDSTPPQTSLVTQSFSGSSASFSFSANEPALRYTCTLDGGDPAVCTSPRSYSGLADGSHTFTVFATDLSGNVDATPAARTFNVGLGALRAGRLAPAQGSYIGVHTWVGNSLPPADQEANFEAFEAGVGRKMGIDHWYEPWGDIFPTGREDLDHEDGRIPMISWSKPKTGTVLDITAGNYDSYINARADGIKALGYPIFLRWFWEMDGTRNAEVAVSPGAYQAAWRYIHDMFENRGVTNAVWVWCPNAAAFETGVAAPFYPGDSYVDWVCADGYNYYPDAGVTYRTFTAKYQAFYDWAVAQGKPAMVGEWGAQQMEPGRRAEWIDEAHQALVTRFPGFMANVYFHLKTDTHDWTLPPEPDAWAAYKALASDPWFLP